MFKRTTPLALWEMDRVKQDQPQAASSEAVRETQVRGLGVWNQVMVEEVAMAKGGVRIYFKGRASTVAGPDSGEAVEGKKNQRNLLGLWSGQ